MLNTLFKPDSILIVLGPGGVGKTTVSAALGIAAARNALRTGVLTVDPARRLRDALEIRELGGEPRPLSARRLRAAGLDPKLPLDAFALDVKQSWDEMVLELTPDREHRRQLLENPFYQELTSRFAGAESYAALEALLRSREGGQFSLLIVDTPPAQHSFDFLDAPDKLLQLLDSSTARWLTRLNRMSRLPGLRAANRVGRFVIEQLETVAGARTFSSIADFFEAIAGARSRLSARMREAIALLHSSNVAFVLVTTPEQDRLIEALGLLDRMLREGYRVSAVVVNRAIGEVFGCISPPTLMETLNEVAILNGSIAKVEHSRPRFRSMLKRLSERVEAEHAVVERVDAFARKLPPSVMLVRTPELEPAVRNLADLARFADEMRPVRS